MKILRIRMKIRKKFGKAHADPQNFEFQVQSFADQHNFEFNADVGYRGTAHKILARPARTV
jgi:hypothetical protein